MTMKETAIVKKLKFLNFSKTSLSFVYFLFCINVNLNIKLENETFYIYNMLIAVN